jgi:hypothetical protein
MRNRSAGPRVVSLLSGLALVLVSTSGPVVAASPSAVSMKVAGATQLRGVSEKTVKPGWVVDTFTASGTTVRAFGRAASTLTFGGAVNPGKNGSLSFSMTSPATADAKGAANGDATAPGAVEALIALGVDPKIALEQFGGMDTIDGSTPASDVALATVALQGVDQPAVAGTSAVNASLASTKRAVPVSAVAPGATVSTTTPYDTQCATVNEVGGKVQGYGCSTIYLVYKASTTDWYFSNKYKFSAQSTSMSLFPLRLRSVNWRLAWAANNLLRDWDPAATVNVGNCSTVSVKSSTVLPSGSTVEIGISAPICPNNYGPWGPLNSTQSGATWNGQEQGNAFEAAIGTQELRSPSNASSSHTSAYDVSFSCGLDC